MNGLLALEPSLLAGSDYVRVYTWVGKQSHAEVGRTSGAVSDTMDRKDASERADCSERAPPPLPALLARLDELPPLPLPLALEREPRLHPALADTKDAARKVCRRARLFAAADTNESVRSVCPCRAYQQRSSVSAPLIIYVPF